MKASATTTTASNTATVNIGATIVYSDIKTCARISSTKRGDKRNQNRDGNTQDAAGLWLQA